MSPPSLLMAAHGDHEPGVAGSSVALVQMPFRIPGAAT